MKINLKNISMSLLLGSLGLGLTACDSTTLRNGTLYQKVPQANNADESKQQRMQAASKINAELGLAYLQRKQLPMAKKKLLLAVQQDSNSVVALDSLAYYWEVTGENKLADRYYRKAITVSSKSGRALNNYGTFLCRTGKYKTAEKYLLAAANIENYIDTAAAYENAGLCELGVPNKQKAITYFKKALEQDPNRQTSSYELAKLYYQQKNYKTAQGYMIGYKVSGKPSAEALWLGIRIAKKMNNSVSILKDGAQLEKQFPNSKQAKLYQKMQLS